MTFFSHQRQIMVLIHPKTAKTVIHHCTFSFITAHFVHYCTLKQALGAGSMERWMNGWNGVNDINHPAMISLALSVLLTFYPIHYKPSDRNSVKIFIFC